ncbi:hypothetical protein ACIQ34_14375 [Ureibacillus sp. NPDC094379]
MSKNIEENSPYYLELDGLKLIRTINLDETGNLGILLAEEELEIVPSCSVIRVYLINLDGGQYEIVKELNAYYFKSNAEALEFSTRLETFSAIDMILFLNNEKNLVTY